MPPLSSLVIGFQGIFGILNGAASLLIPAAAQYNLDVMKIDSLPAIHAIGLGSITIGAFYIDAARRNDRNVMWLFVLGRVIAIPVFSGHGGPWVNVACLEGLFGLMAGAALAWEQWEMGKGRGVESEDSIQLWVHTMSWSDVQECGHGSKYS